MTHILLLLIIFATIVAGDVKKILTVGDSWASYSGNSFAKFCPCAVQIQKGIGGTTSVQWAAGEGEESFPAALTAAGTMNGNDIIVMSLGGNDWLGVNCQGKSLATLQGEIQAAADALIAAVTATGCGNDCPTIWMFGYAMVASGEDGCASAGPAAMAPLKQAIINVAAATPAINFQDITSICGGSSNQLSPASPCFGMGDGHDNIHMNQQGYCKVITQSSVQAAFSCNTQSVDCAAVDKDLASTTRNAEACSDSFTACEEKHGSVAVCSSNGPNPAPPAASSTLVTKSVTLVGITSDQFGTTQQTAFKTAIANNVGSVCCDCASSATTRACTAADVTLALSRRDVSLSYSVAVAGTASTAASSTLATYQASAQFATDLQAASVPVTSVTVQEPASVPSEGTDGSEITLIAVGAGVVALVVGIGCWFIFCRSSSPSMGSGGDAGKGQGV